MGAPPLSDTAIVAIAQSFSICISGSLPACFSPVYFSTFPMNMLTTTNETGISAVCDQVVSYSRTSRRDSRRLVRFVNNWELARKTARWTSRYMALIALFSVEYIGMKLFDPAEAITSLAAR